MSRCLARVTYEASKRYFADEKHYFYLEFQCESLVKDGQQMCPKCRFKNGTRTQEAKSYDHGLIGGEIPEKSHIYGSKWYFEAEKKYGKPKDLEECLFMAKKKTEEGETPPVKKKRIKKTSTKVEGVAVTERVTPQVLNFNKEIKYVVSFEEPIQVREIRTIVLEEDSERDGVWVGEGVEVERSESGEWVKARFVSDSD